MRSQQIETEAYGVKLGVKEEDNIIVRYKRFKVKIFILLYTNLILYLGTEAYTIIANYKEAQNITPCIPGIIFIILGILVPILTHNLTFRKRKVDTIERGRKASSHSSVGGGGSRIKSIISLLSE